MHGSALSIRRYVIVVYQVLCDVEEGARERGGSDSAPCGSTAKRKTMNFGSYAGNTRRMSEGSGRVVSPAAGNRYLRSPRLGCDGIMLLLQGPPPRSALSKTFTSIAVTVAADSSEMTRAPAVGSIARVIPAFKTDACHDVRRRSVPPFPNTDSARIISHRVTAIPDRKRRMHSRHRSRDQSNG